MRDIISLIFDYDCDAVVKEQYNNMARINHCLYQITLNMWVNTSQHKNSAYLTSFICAMQFDPNDFSVPQIDIDIWRTYMRDKNTILISSKCCLFSSAFYAFCIIIITSRIDGTV